MADWTNIADSVLEPGDPVRSVDMLAMRDNPIAIAERAPGAPRGPAPEFIAKVEKVNRTTTVGFTAVDLSAQIPTHAQTALLEIFLKGVGAAQTEIVKFRETGLTDDYELTLGMPGETTSQAWCPVNSVQSFDYSLSETGGGTFQLIISVIGYFGV